MRKPTVVAFDFDGTVTIADTFNELVIFYKGRWAWWWFMAKHCIYVAGYALGLIDNTVIKEKMLESFFKGIPSESFSQLCQAFSQSRLPQIINPKALEKITYHQKKNEMVVIVTASLSDWIEPWAKANGITTLITSTAEIAHQKITGKLLFNCYGEKKKTAFLHHFPERDSYHLIAYGDSKADLPLLQLADEQYYRRFYP